MEQIHLVLVAAIDEPDDPDRLSVDPNYIQELANSIRERGLQQEILVRPRGDRYEVVYGRCRLLAHRLLKATEIKAKVRDLSDEDTLLLRSIENLQRVNLSPVEEGLSYKRLHENCGLSLEEIGRKVGKSVGLVKRRLDLLLLPDDVKDAVHSGKIPYSVAEQLYRLRDPERMSYYLYYAIENGATRDVVRGWIDEEQAQQRQRESTGGGGGGYSNPFVTKPVYVACDKCEGPMEIGQETVLRVCRNCVTEIKS